MSKIYDINQLVTKYKLTQDRAAVRRLIASISGLEKQGKTHFGLTAPGPLAYVGIDVGDEGVLEKFTPSKRVIPYDIDVVDDIPEMVKIWNQFFEFYFDMLATKELRSIVIDTATEVWELLRLAKFGQLTQVMPYQYGPVNAIYRRMIKEAYKHDKSLLLLHKMKPVYINDKRTKDYERAGFGDTGFLVQLNAQVWREDASTDPETNAFVPGKFHIFIKDSRHNPDLAGLDLEGEMCTFPWLATMSMGGSPDEWA